MPSPTQLLARLEAIGASLEHTGKGLALLALGSVGTEIERLDEYSDLDFFAIVRSGHKAAFIQDLDWMGAPCPISYCFQNTADGYKLLYEDGIFCEFAVFEPHELAGIPFAAGRLVWRAPDFDETLCVPAPRHPGTKPSTEYLLGEALTNLYVGLCRFRRGEKLSAAHFIQGYAVDRIVELAEGLEAGQPARRDPFTAERRFEQRFPGLSAELPHFVQGYERSPQSARAILAFLERHFAINATLRAVILHLCES